MTHPLPDMSPEDFRAHAHRVADLVADYLGRIESYPVVPRMTPGEIRARLPTSPPEQGESMVGILDDYRRLIEPNVTHWQHPGFLAYFPSSAAGAAILAEMLVPALASNVMLWRNAPASTELEEVVVSWLRQLYGLPESFDGMLTDTASISTLTALVAARHALGREIRTRGLSGRDDLGRIRIYGSTETHSSIEKAAIVAGLGSESLRRVAIDASRALDPAALAEAIRADRAAGEVPMAVVATLGTTSSTAIDPVARIAEICGAEKIWLHVDAAYGGTAALLPEKRALFSGWERADSIVVNPHKWMFTPFDASILLFRDPETFRGALSLVPDYLRTPIGAAHDYHEYGIQLGRRFRALKLWMLLRWFGAEGIRQRLRHHLALAEGFAKRIKREPHWELFAPVPLATVTFRHLPSGLEGEALDLHNERVLAKVNADGRFYLSGTRLDGRFVIRMAVGNLRTEANHLDELCRLLVDAGEASP